MARKNSFDFFANRDCPYFPCHSGADGDSFNCLFCYCPLYCLGRDCGGNFTYTDKGVKDCSACLLPHSPEGYDYILKQYPRILQRMAGGEEAGHERE